MSADRRDNSSAEITAIIWALAWLLEAQLSPLIPVTIWPDNQAAGITAAGEAIAKAHPRLVKAARARGLPQCR